MSEQQYTGYVHFLRWCYHNFLLFLPDMALSWMIVYPLLSLELAHCCCSVFSFLCLSSYAALFLSSDLYCDMLSDVRLNLDHIEYYTMHLGIAHFGMGPTVNSILQIKPSTSPSARSPQ